MPYDYQLKQQLLKVKRFKTFHSLKPVILYIENKLMGLTLFHLMTRFCLIFQWLSLWM